MTLTIRHIATRFALLLGIALLFSYRYATYIPGTFGPHRLYDYVCLLVLLLVLGCLEQAVGLLSRLRAGLPAIVCYNHCATFV